MHPHIGLDVVAPVPVGRDLELDPFEGDGVVVADDPVILLAEDVFEGCCADPLDESPTPSSRGGCMNSSLKAGL